VAGKRLNKSTQDAVCIARPTKDAALWSGDNLDFPDFFMIPNFVTNHSKHPTNIPLTELTNRYGKIMAEM
jgi:hypothetical protein